VQRGRDCTLAPRSLQQHCTPGISTTGYHPPTQASSRHGALHSSTGRQKSRGLANSSQIRYEALEALQASQGSPGGSGAILAYASAILEALPGQGRMAESQFRPLPVPRYPVLHTTHGTSNGFRENRGTGVDFLSPDPIIRLGEERKRGDKYGKHSKQEPDNPAARGPAEDQDGSGSPGKAA
jgi:hypothetical protein